MGVTFKMLHRRILVISYWLRFENEVSQTQISIHSAFLCWEFETNVENKCPKKTCRLPSFQDNIKNLYLPYACSLPVC